MKQISSKSRYNQKGQGMTEYICIVALIAIAAIGAYSKFGQTVRHQVAGLSAELSGTSADVEIGNAQDAATDAATTAADTAGLGDYDKNASGVTN